MISDSGLRMLSMLPDYYEYSQIMQAVLDAKGVEHDDLKADIQDVVNQLNVQTATWGLKIWENGLGLPINEALANETRRARILGRLKGQGIATKAKVKQVVETFVTTATITELFQVIERTDLTVAEVKRYTVAQLALMDVDNLHDSINGNKLQVTINDPTGVPDNLADIQRAVEDAKPAHIQYEIITT